MARVGGVKFRSHEPTFCRQHEHGQTLCIARTSAVAANITLRISVPTLIFNYTTGTRKNKMAVRTRLELR